MRIARYIALIAALAGATSVAGAQAGGPAATIERAAKAVKQSGVVTATFEQTLNNPLTGNQARSNGELALSQPDRLSLRFQGAGDRVVSDGRWLWVYLPSAAPGQVLKLPASRGSGVGLDVVADLLDSPRAKFDVADGGAAMIGGRATHAVVLTPKKDGQGITRAEVWVDDADASVRQIALTQDSGLERTWRMTSWTTNAKVPASTFRFDVPAGARVVDQASFTGAP